MALKICMASTRSVKNTKRRSQTRVLIRTKRRLELVLSHERRNEILRHNKEVRQIREILKFITEADLQLPAKILAFRSHESKGNLNKVIINS